MAELIREIVPYEPIRSNRWIIDLGDIPQYLMSDFKIQNQKFTTKGRKPKEMMGIKLDISIRNSTTYVTSPTDVIDCKNIKISFLDPTGEEMSFYDMDVEFDTFNVIGDYGDDGLLMTKCSFWVKDFRTPRSIKLDKETLENYLDKKTNPTS